MDYCRKCRIKTKGIGKPKFIKNRKTWRRISICKICDSEKNNISKPPEDIEIEELFKPVRKRYPTRKVIQVGIGNTYQIDLYFFYRSEKKKDDPSYNLRFKSENNEKDSDFKKLKKINNGYIGVMNVIDIFSKYAWSVPIKTKSGLELANAFILVIESSKVIPKYIHCDEERGIYSKIFKEMVLDKYNIILYSTGTQNKASIIERFNRTFGNKIKPILFKTGKWLDALPEVIKNYNNTIHSTIKMKPSQVNKNNEKMLLTSVYNYSVTNNKPKFEVGDRVRLSLCVDIFRNKLKTNWTKEIFIVSKIFISNVIYYKVKDENGEEIKEGIYTEEMQLTKL